MSRRKLEQHLERKLTAADAKERAVLVVMFHAIASVAGSVDDVRSAWLSDVAKRMPTLLDMVPTGEARAA